MCVCVCLTGPIDVNECETGSNLCGDTLCENAEGNYLCICPNENEEFDPVTSQCNPRHKELTGEQTKTATHMRAHKPFMFFLVPSVILIA